jgi:naphthalene 1,2-dioxygenase ferredoxin component
MSQLKWVDATSADELRADDVVGITINGREIAIYAVGDAVYATDNLCTHGNGKLCDGFLEGHEIECPLHQGRFDVRDGKPLCEPVSDPLRSYPVKLEGRRVFVRLN